MFGIHQYRSFVAAILIFQAIPGPGTLAILNATARDGVRAGLGAVLGTLTGDFIFMVAAVAGLAAVMQANPVLFQALQWFGAGYLVWMGIQLMRTRPEAPAGPSGSGRSGWRRYRQAMAVSFTNPKVVLFFMAFFPLFLSPHSSRSTLAVMMAHVTVLSLCYQVGLVLVGNAVASRLKGYPWARRLTSTLAGIALVGFGLKLAANNR